MSDFLGNEWSLFPPGNLKTGLNIVSGVNLIAANIFTIALLQPGEDAIHPKLGIAPELFGSKNEPSVQYYEHLLQESISTYLKGKISSVWVRATKTDKKHQLNIEIYFSLADDPSQHTLTFGFYVYPELNIEYPVLDGNNWNYFAAPYSTFEENDYEL